MDVRDFFHDIFKGRVVIVGIGNSMKGDDAAGLLLADRLEGKISALCINAGTVPENYAEKIINARPDTILLIDAAHINRLPGQYEILGLKDIEKTGFTTHNISPAIFFEYIKSQCGAKIFLLAIQPESVTFGEKLSDGVKEAIDRIEALIKETSNNA